MRIFKVIPHGSFYEVWEAIRDFCGRIIRWEFILDTCNDYQAYGYINLMGREYDPAFDR